MYTYENWFVYTGANLEYLKNVVLTYMLSTDIASRNDTLYIHIPILHVTTLRKTQYFPLFYDQKSLLVFKNILQNSYFQNNLLI